MDQGGLEGLKERARRPIRVKRHNRRSYEEDKRPPKRLFTPEIKKYLKDWLVRRRDNPYPNRDEKKSLAVQTGLTYIQVCNWFANWRRKLKNAGREPQRKTWGHLIKTYNNQVHGNVEHFSISSNDSIWHEIDNNNSEIKQAQCFYLNQNSEQCSDDNPFAQHKYKNHIMEKYLRDCQNSANKVIESEPNNPTIITRWLESAANFKPSQENYLNWTYEMNEKKIKKGVNQHGREELDAAEALAFLAHAV